MKLFCIVLLVATCGPQDEPTTVEQTVRARAAAERIVALETGEDVTEEAMLADLEQSRVIYIGEDHDEAADHAVQYRLIRELYDRHPSIGIGLEMVQYPYQSVLDAWSAGNLDETNLRRRVEWEERWGHDFGFYRPLFQWARSRAIPLYALNAPTEVTRVLAKEGFDGLSTAQREELPPLDLTIEGHRDLVMEALGSHHHADGDPEALERYYLAQVAWDETMAERVAEATEVADGPSRVVVLAGRLHVHAGLGIPLRASRRGVERYRVILIAHDADALEELMESQPRPADYVWLVAE